MQEKVKRPKGPARPKGDLDPQWAWDRHLPAWGAMGVDFESRVEFPRQAFSSSTSPYASTLASALDTRALSKSEVSPVSPVLV
jgi:hypothetical protein